MHFARHTPTFHYARFTAIAVALFSSGASLAATIETLAEADWEGQAISDPQGPSTSGSLESRAEPGGAVAVAVQDIDGAAAVRVEGMSANGQRGNTLLARSVWSESFTNTSGGAQRFVAQLSIPSISLFISDDTVAVPADRTTAYYDISLEVNGGVMFSSGATLSGNTTGHDFVLTGTSFGGTGQQSGQRFRFDFLAFDGAVTLGDFAPDATLQVVYRIEAGIDMPGFELFADASIGDPLTLQTTSIAIGASPVPLPGAAWLFAAALVSLVRRRRACAS